MRKKSKICEDEIEFKSEERDRRYITSSILFNNLLNSFIIIFFYYI